MRRTKFVEAHTTAVACIALSLDGKLLATASERGTLVRIFSTADGSKVQVSTDVSLQHIQQSCWRALPEPGLEFVQPALCKHVYTQFMCHSSICGGILGKMLCTDKRTCEPCIAPVQRLRADIACASKGTNRQHQHMLTHVLCMPD